MKYLFFDIECANNINKQSKIYSFGYVITDGNFLIINKEDIIMNPDSPFDEHIKKSILAYDENEIKKYPTFEKRFPLIENLLTQNKQVNFGFAVHNDADFILDECRRYHLKCPNMIFYDVMLLAKSVLKMKDSIGLKKLVQLLEIESTAQFHMSEADAYYTMKILEVLCQRSGKNVLTLVEGNPQAKIEIYKEQIRRQKQIKKKEVAFVNTIGDQYKNFFTELGHTKDKLKDKK